MAPRHGLLRRRNNSSVLVSVFDKRVGSLVFRFNVKRLFSDDESRRRRRRRPREVLPLPPSHVACFRRLLTMDLAASPGGDKIVAATIDGHIMVYDATKSQSTYGQDLRCRKLCPILLAVRSRPSGAAQGRRLRLRLRRGDDMSMLVATGRPNLAKPEPYFEALRLTSGGRLQHVPVPPTLLLFGDALPPVPPNSWRYGYRAQVTSYFVAGGRAWLSVVGEAGKQGTYSLDMAAPELGWRSEGSWVLPLKARAVYAPDLGLLLGFTPGLLELCAIDMEARPPVIRHQEWSMAILLPSKDDGYSPEQHFFRFGGLAYLGGGRLCISWASPYQDQAKHRILALTAVELTRIMTNGGELLLRKRRSRCYRLPPYSHKAIVLPVL